MILRWTRQIQAVTSAEAAARSNARVANDVTRPPHDVGQRQGPEGQDHGEGREIRDPKEPPLGQSGLQPAHEEMTPEQLETGHGQRGQEEEEAPGGREPPGNGQGGEQPEHEGELEALTPLQQREVPPSVFQGLGLMDHGELQVGRGVVHGQPTRLHEQQEHVGHHGEQERRAQVPETERHAARGDHVSLGGSRGPPESEDHEEEDRLGQRPHPHVPARAHSTEGAPRIQGGQGDDEPGEGQEADQDDEVPHVSQRGGKHEPGDERDRGQQGREGDRGGPARQPGRGVRVDRALSQELPEVPVRLKQGAAGPALAPGLHPAAEGKEQRADGENERILQQEEDHRPHHAQAHGVPPQTTRTSRSKRTRVVNM